MTGDGMEQVDAPPRWRDLGDSRDLAAAVRTAYQASPRTSATLTTVAGVHGVTPVAADETDALTLLRIADRPRRGWRHGARFSRRALAVLAAAGALVVAAGAPRAVLARLNPVVETTDAPVTTPRPAAPATTTLAPDAMTYEPVVESPGAAEAPATTLATTEEVTTPTTAARARRTTPTTRAAASSSPTTAAPQPQSPPASDPPPEEPTNGDGW